MTTFVIFLLHLILNLQINENKKYFYSHQLIHNKTVIICLEYVICSLTEHGIVLSQAEQFDVLDLYKTLTQDYDRSSYFELIDEKIHGSD